MTATRDDGDTPKRTRPSQRPGRLTAAAVLPAAPPPAPHVPAEDSGMRTKYTTMLDEETRDAFERLTQIARKQRGRHVDRAELLSALVLLAADDAALRDQVIAMLPARSRRGPKRQGTA